MSDFDTDPVSVLLSQWQAYGNSGTAQDMFGAIFGQVGLPGTYTVDTLPTPNASNLGKYAVVSDLFGEKTDKVLCAKSGTFYYWQPLRPVYDKSIVVSTDISLFPLKNASVITMSGTIGLGVTRQVTLSTSFAWPGAQQEVKFPGAILGALNILGTGLGSGVALLGGGYQKYSCELVSGALAWKRLV